MFASAENGGCRCCPAAAAAAAAGRTQRPPFPGLLLVVCLVWYPCPRPLFYATHGVLCNQPAGAATRHMWQLELGIPCCWHHWQAGHGKGEHDGVGTVVKAAVWQEAAVEDGWVPDLAGLQPAQLDPHPLGGITGGAGRCWCLARKGRQHTAPQQRRRRRRRQRRQRRSGCHPLPLVVPATQVSKGRCGGSRGSYGGEGTSSSNNRRCRHRPLSRRLCALAGASPTASPAAAAVAAAALAALVFLAT